MILIRRPAVPAPPEDRPMTAKQLEAFKDLLRRQRATVETTLPMLPKLRLVLEGRSEAAFRVHNVLEFATLYGYDFNCVFEDMLEHQGTRRGLVYARFLVLLVYEASNKFRSLLGGQFQADLRSLGYGEDEVVLGRGIHNCFVRAFERCNRDFGDVRHGVVAHRDESGANQYGLIDKAQVREVVHMTLEMEECMVRLSALLANHVQLLVAALQQEAESPGLSEPERSNKH